MKTMSERHREARRLMILRVLAAIEGRRLDQSLMSRAMRDLDYETERSLLQSELRWMERQGLVLIETDRPTWLITLTERGDQARRGVIEEPGVARPDLP